MKRSGHVNHGLAGDCSRDPRARRSTRTGKASTSRLGEERSLCSQFWRRPGRHHLGQVCVQHDRGLSDRKRQDRAGGQGRDAHRQRAGGFEEDQHDRQRPAAG